MRKADRQKFASELWRLAGDIERAENADDAMDVYAQLKAVSEHWYVMHKRQIDREILESREEHFAQIEAEKALAEESGYTPSAMTKLN